MSAPDLATSPYHSSNHTFRSAAEVCLRRGWAPIPLCWPTIDDGCTCGCGKGHLGHDVGKAPLVMYRGLTLSEIEREYPNWAEKWPLANVGVLLEPSGLLVIGPDCDEALADWRSFGLPATTIRYSNHDAYIYRRPVACGIARKCQSDYGDVLTGGYVVVFGTHAAGCKVHTTDDEPRDAPDWAVRMLAEPKKAEPRERPQTADVDADPPVRLRTEEARGLWNGSLVISTVGDVRPAEGTDPDRSRTLFHIGLALANAGASRSTIVVGLAERDETLGYRKYADRRDAGSGQYQAIADRVVEQYETTGSRLGGEATASVDKRELAASRPVLLRMNEVTPEPVRWIWPKRIPVGKLTMLDGDPGLGKSFITIDLAARVSCNGLMPDGSRSDLAGPAGVVLLSAEDDPADTIRPRLDAAGADCSRIVLLRGVETTEDRGGKSPRLVRSVTLADAEAIEAAIRSVDAGMIVVDPVPAYTVGDTHVDAVVRQSLDRLAQLAQRVRVAVLAVRHLNKSGGGNPLYRGGGSIAFIAAARSGLLVAVDPNDPDGKRRVLASTKSNLGELPPSLIYRLETGTSGTRVVWEGESPHTARTLLAQPVDHPMDGKVRSAIGEATMFVRDLLADGPMPAKGVAAAAEEAGIATGTLRRAADQLGISKRKEGQPDSSEQRWVWELPVEPTRGSAEASSPKVINDPEDDHSPGMSTFGVADHLRENCMPDDPVDDPDEVTEWSA